MKLIGLLCLVNCVVFAFAASAIEPRIVRGERASRGQFPYQASLRDVVLRQHFCGATIIHPRFLLTAAHCNAGLFRLPYSFVAVVGAVRRQFDGVAYIINKVMRHENFNLALIHNDISLIRTAREIVFTANIQPIALPKQNDMGDTLVVASGWGNTKESAIFPPFNLQYTHERTLSHEDCVKALDRVDTHIHPNYTLCSMPNYVVTGYAGLCYGDSGKLIN